MIDWKHWHNEPLLIGGLVFLSWLYAILAGPLRERLAGPGTPYPRRKAVMFYSSLLIFYIATGSPLDQIAERFLLSVHMLQHQLMTYPSALLFLLGLPEWMIRPVTAQASLQTLLRFLTRPVVCGLVFVIVNSCWHFTFLYDWALQFRLLHVFEHITMYGSALFFWWPICSPSREFPPAKYATQMFYFVAVTIGMTPVFAYITFSSDILYPTYEYAPRICWMTPEDDQLLAGAGMKMVSMTIMMIAFAVSFYRWHHESEKKPR